jgi:hypothetical protein
MAASIRDLARIRRMAALQGSMDANVNLARLRTPQQADELGPVFDELEQNVDDARRIGLEKNEGLSPEMRPLKGLPPISRGGAKVLAPGMGFTTVVQNYHSPPEDAEMIAVSIGVTPFNQIADVLEQIELVGKVTWGMGGANFEALFDVFDGVTFSLPACKIRIDVAFPPTFQQEGNTNVIINAGLAYGIFAQQSSPTRLTVPYGPIEPGGFFQAQIPAFATAFTVLSTPLSVFWPPGPAWAAAQVPTAILVSETATPPPTERRALFQLTDDTNVSLHAEWQFPLFAGSRFVTLRNNGNDAVLYEVVYNLAF